MYRIIDAITIGVRIQRALWDSNPPFGTIKRTIQRVNKLRAE